MENLLRIRRDRVEWRLIEGEIVAIDLERSLYLGLNKSAAVMWPSLIEGVELPALADQLVAAYGLDQETALRDVRAFVEELRAQDLLE